MPTERVGHVNYVDMGCGELFQRLYTIPGVYIASLHVLLVRNTFKIGKNAYFRHFSVGQHIAASWCMPAERVSYGNHLDMGCDELFQRLYTIPGVDIFSVHVLLVRNAF